MKKKINNSHFHFQLIKTLFIMLIMLAMNTAYGRSETEHGISSSGREVNK